MSEWRRRRQRQRRSERKQTSSTVGVGGRVLDERDADRQRDLEEIGAAVAEGDQVVEEEQRLGSAVLAFGAIATEEVQNVERAEVAAMGSEQDRVLLVGLDQGHVLGE